MDDRPHDGPPPGREPRRGARRRDDRPQLRDDPPARPGEARRAADDRQPRAGRSRGADEGRAPSPPSGRAPGDRRRAAHPPPGSGPERRPVPPPSGPGGPAPAGRPGSAPGPDGPGPESADEPWLRRRERDAAAEAERAAAWSASRGAHAPLGAGRGGHTDSRPTDIRSLGAARGIGETVRTTGRPDTAAERRRHRAAEPGAPPEERGRAARLSGELPVVPRRSAGTAAPATGGPGAPPDRRGGPGRAPAPADGLAARPGRSALPDVPSGRPGPGAPADRPARPGAPADVPSRPGPADGPARPNSGTPADGPARPGSGAPSSGRPGRPSGGRPARSGADDPARPGAAGPPDPRSPWTAAPVAPGDTPPPRPAGAPQDQPPGPGGRSRSGRPDAAPGRPDRPGRGDGRPDAARRGPGPAGPARPGGRPPARPPRDTPVAAAAAAATTVSPAGDGPAADGRKKPGPPQSARRRVTDTARATLGAALGLTAASTVLPGSGHLALRRRRTGGLILGTLVAIVVAVAVLALVVRRSTLLQNLLSTTTLTVLAGALVVGGIGWIAQVARTYALARPRGLPLGQKIVGTGTAALLCLAVAVPFGYGVELLNSQRGLLNSLFQGGGGTSAADALGKPRLNVLLLGSDAGEDRSGTRTDTMMLASIDTRSGRTTLFSLPRNIQRAEFPPGTPAAEEFPDGFHDSSQPLSGDYLLNGVFAYGEQHPDIAPSTPTQEPGLNLLQSTISYMTGLPIDYYLEVNMAGFSSMIDAVGGVTVNVGADPIPVGGVTAFGRHTTPDRYIQPGVQTLNGEDALWFARSRRDGTDYQRMGRQRCLIQAVVSETSATELVGRFQSIAAVARENVATDMPQQVLPALAVLADEGFRLESVAFDPSLPDPNSDTGFFVTADPDAEYMREVVQDAIADPPPAPDPALAAPAPPTSQAPPSSETPESATPSATAAPEPASAAPQSVAESCAETGAADVPSPEEQGAAEGAAGTGGTTNNGLGPAEGLRPDEY
ncbi:LCP family protein [Pseudonocardia sp. HH130630-07]|uniref:LCP family protein n=1 Tax=Pseudonocardia sp. HH130630-07 TaxID=1690815 RepID=UPI0008151131|nr:LCP family protein [Pseudonocardia sp. HH130630-07]ANY07971.1 hypothetical protein AFB00_18575 [Pseudonocardia sp. HH130630-07]